MPGSMPSLLNEYGALLLFVNVLLVQLGLPIPAVPALVIAGGLAAAGQFNPVLIIAAAVTASTLADYGWYLAGRRMGYTVLIILCRLSLSPDLCVRQAETSYDRWGPSLLLLAKFIPGLATIAPPLAGVLRMPRHVFLFFAGMGGLLWAGAFVALGYALDAQANIVLASLESFGHYTTLAAAAVLATYVLYRLVQRKRLLNMFEATRMSAEQVLQLLAAPTTPVLIDVRSPVARSLDGRRLPGALAFDVTELDKILRTIRKESHLVVFCACPNEVSAAHMATRLRQLGYLHVSPLKDGIDGWARAGLPVLTAAKQS